jgi:hypothetical protein
MVDFLRGALAFIVRSVNFVLNIVATVTRMQRLARLFTSSDAIVEVPPDPKVLPPEAQRALAEARGDGASFIDKYVGASRK